MRPAALSIAVYGFYLAVNGAGLLLWPTLPLGLLGLPAANEPWARLFGLVAGELGCYFAFAARRDYTAFYSATVYGRGGAAAVFVGLVWLQLGSAQLPEQKVVKTRMLNKEVII